MAGYSTTPLAKKLGIKPGNTVVLLNAPKGFEKALEGLPADVRLKRRLPAARSVDIIAFFTNSSEVLEARFPALRKRLADTGGLWVCWPKKTSGVPTDLTEDMVRAIALAGGLVDNKVCAIDEVWSGLRLVVRLRDRKA